LKLLQEQLQVHTRGRGFTNVTAELQHLVQSANVERGLCHVFIQHTSASLVVQENADPAVLRDLQRWAEDLAPESRAWEHDDEGPDDMPAHARSAITRTSESIPVSQGRLALGTWQGVYIWEHRARAQTRTLFITLLGE
jgi:secondary thiamine-phosphate synthase enzyme